MRWCSDRAVAAEGASCGEVSEIGGRCRIYSGHEASMSVVIKSPYLVQRALNQSEWAKCELVILGIWRQEMERGCPHSSEIVGSLRRDIRIFPLDPVQDDSFHELEVENVICLVDANLLAKPVSIKIAEFRIGYGEDCG